MSKSQFVVAERYQLLEAVSVKEGLYKKDGMKKLVHTPKVLKRSYVEEQNAQLNAVHYVIDEEASAKLDDLREKNRLKNKEREARSKVEFADLVDAVKGKQPAKDEGPTAEEVLAITAKEREERKAKAKAEAEAKAEEAAKAAAKAKEESKAAEKEAADLMGLPKPGSKAKLDEIRAYMDQEGIPYTQEDTKAALMERIEEFSA